VNKKAAAAALAEMVAQNRRAQIDRLLGGNGGATAAYELANILGGALDQAIRAALCGGPLSDWPATIPARRRAMRDGLRAAIAEARDLLATYELEKTP
jgi:hypothetical protein